MNGENEKSDVQEEIEKLKIAQATQTATLTGMEATNAAATAGAQAAQAAATAGLWSTMMAGSVALIVGLFLGMMIRK